MLKVLTNPYVIALGVPLIFLMCGAVARKLVRKSRGWQRQDFYLGIQGTLASLSASLLYIFELLKRIDNLRVAKQPIAADTVETLIATGMFIVSTFFLLLLVLSWHQDWQDSEHDSDRRQVMRLGLLSNGVGLGLLASFILWIKGV